MPAASHAALCAHPLLAAGATYQRRQPEHTTLYRELEQHWPASSTRFHEEAIAVKHWTFR